MSSSTATVCVAFSSTTRRLLYSGVLVVASLMSQIIGFSTNYWFNDYEDSHVRTHFGLWNYCSCFVISTASSKCGNSICVSWNSPSLTYYTRAEFLTVAQAAECIGLVLLIIATVLVLFQLFGSQKGTIKSWTISCALLAAMSISIGVVLFSVYVARAYGLHGSRSFDYSFCMCTAAAAIIIFIVIPCLISDRSSALRNQQPIPPGTQANTGDAGSSPNTSSSVMYTVRQVVYLDNPAIETPYGEQQTSTPHILAPIASDQPPPYETIFGPPSYSEKGM